METQCQNAIEGEGEGAHFEFLDEVIGVFYYAVVESPESAHF